MRRVVYAASSSAYGDAPGLPKVETMAPDLLSPYALQKQVGEVYCRLYTQLYGLETVALRYFNVYGPRQDPRSDYAAVIPRFVTACLRGEPPTIYGDGEQTRDFIYVKDIAAANAYFATQSPATGVFNVAYGRKMTINDLAQTICRLTNSRSEIKYTAERPGDVKHSMAAVDKLRAAGFTPTGNLSDGLAATVEFFQSRS